MIELDVDVPLQQIAPQRARCHSSKQLASGACAAEGGLLTARRCRTILCLLTRGRETEASWLHVLIAV
eukprot:4931515-Pleurochrysis_carterae.AAC.2